MALRPKVQVHFHFLRGRGDRLPAAMIAKRFGRLSGELGMRLGSAAIQLPPHGRPSCDSLVPWRAPLHGTNGHPRVDRTWRVL